MNLLFLQAVTLQDHRSSSTLNHLTTNNMLKADVLVKAGD